jgi:hypothetical protein
MIQILSHDSHSGFSDYAHQPVACATEQTSHFSGRVIVVDGESSGLFLGFRREPGWRLCLGFIANGASVVLRDTHSLIILLIKSELFPPLPVCSIYFGAHSFRILLLAPCFVFPLAFRRRARTHIVLSQDTVLKASQS